MMKNERLKKLKELETKYDAEIKNLIQEVATKEANFKKHFIEVIANGKKSDRRMNFAGIFMAFGTFLSSMIFPLSGGNPIVGILAIGVIAGALANGIVQWIKSEKCDKEISKLKPMEEQNYNECLKLRENIAVLQNNKFKVKAEIEKLKGELLHQNVQSKTNSTKKHQTQKENNNIEITK